VSPLRGRACIGSPLRAPRPVEVTLGVLRFRGRPRRREISQATPEATLRVRDLLMGEADRIQRRIFNGREGVHKSMLSVRSRDRDGLLGRDARGAPSLKTTPIESRRVARVSGGWIASRATPVDER
jgi:hypothetical protein